MKSWPSKIMLLQLYKVLYFGVMLLPRSLYLVYMQIANSFNSEFLIHEWELQNSVEISPFKFAMAKCAFFGLMMKSCFFHWFICRKELPKRERFYTGNKFINLGYRITKKNMKWSFFHSRFYDTKYYFWHNSALNKRRKLFRG